LLFHEEKPSESAAIKWARGFELPLVVTVSAVWSGLAARDWDVVRWDENAASYFQELRSDRVRIGTQDLKIASIALANDALLLTANSRDFEKVPGLHVEDWI
jgi:predicted nucleic acid-binding protein